MGQIRTNYEESKQWIDVRNIGQLKVFAFSPCILIGTEGEPTEMAVCAVNDRSVDADFKGQFYRIAMSGQVDIPAGGHGRVSIDWPLIGRVNQDLGDLAVRPEYQIEPSVDGNGLSALYYALAEEFGTDYPYPLGYWHWMGSGPDKAFFNVVAQFYDRPEVSRRLREDGFVLAWVDQKNGRWPYNGGYLDGSWYLRAYQSFEFLIGPGYFDLLPSSANLDDYREIVNPEAKAYQPYYFSSRYYENRSGIYELPNYVHLQSPWKRVVLTGYGEYEVQILATVNPVIGPGLDYYPDALGRRPIARYSEGVQGRFPPFATDDFWLWEYEDFVLLVNRYDFDTAKSVCQVDTIEHRQPLGAQALVTRGLFAPLNESRRVRVSSQQLGIANGFWFNWILYENTVSGEWVVYYVWTGFNLYLGGGEAKAYSVNNPGVNATDAWAAVLANIESVKGGNNNVQGIIYGGTGPALTTETGGMPYLDVFSKAAPSDFQLDEVAAGQADIVAGNHVVSRFILKVGRPEKLGSYKGVAKTVLEFRVYSRSEAVAASQYASVLGKITRFSKSVDVIGD